jgi:glycosyltransferase involved in cell wall biosynthesis
MPVKIDTGADVSRHAGRFLFLEPFFGGSHREIAEGLAAASRHRIDLMTMSARFWRWRMSGAALHFARRLPDLSLYDGMVVSGLMSLADLKALAPGPSPPAAVYFHETQLTYPLSEGEKPDVASAWTNVTTALCADRVMFNSFAHRESFLEALPGLVRLMPDYRPGWVVEAIRARSTVVYPGCSFSREAHETVSEVREPPLIVWNHRWEHDKDPGSFFQALDALDDRGLDFRAALLGERYRRIPDVFERGLRRHGDRILQFGYVPSRDAYFDWLRRGTVVVSTALQENFGVAVVEAVRSGCLPLLPNRLSYPELIPSSYHSTCLYRDQEDLEEKLSEVVSSPDGFDSARRQLREAMARFSWERRIGDFDRMLDELALGKPSGEVG